MALLEVNGLRAHFDTSRGAVRAVSDVSFTVEQQSVVGVVGESGCGKSAMLRAVLGLLPPNGAVEGGQAWFGGRDLLSLPRSELREVRGKEIGFVAQRPWGSLHPILRVDKQFRRVIRAHRKASKGECERVALRLLEQVRIPQPERVLRSFPHELSGGMAQRVVIALSMALDPVLVVADEPTTALDVTVQRQILDLLTGLVRSGERSMLIVTHDVGVVAQYCSEVLVMYAGEIVEHGPVSEVFVDPAHPYTEALLKSVPRKGEALAQLAGAPPDLLALEDNCHFAPRCPYAREHCRQAHPVRRPVGREREVACHYDLVGGG